jgi:protein-S-isoprenylcysteine O-methyltransferase Ste14
MVCAADYFIYYYFPLPLSEFLPDRFPISRYFTVTLAALIAVPSSYLMIRGARDAGEETMRPKPEHKMYGGIYRKIRHPQAVGEFPLWCSMALLANSPFLTLFSFLYVPVWYYFCVAEEKDLRIRYGAAFEQYQSTVGFWIPKRVHRRAA